MTDFRFLTAAAWGALAGALVLTPLPAAAQVEHRGTSSSSRETRAEGHAGQAAQRQARPHGAGRGGRASPGHGDSAMAAGHVGAGATVSTNAGPHGRSYTAPRDSSYGAYTRSRDWGVQHQARDAGSRQHLPGGTWGRSQDHGAWQRDRSYGARSADLQHDRRDNYRWGRDYPRWDHRGWRNDNRYDWYSYRAANHGLFNLGRYYAPHRGYSYSRINIGFRLGSPFYASRYWIGDPWRYRLPDVYGPYRWVRYYDDALLVDIYSGEVVDVVYNFFW